MLCTASCPSETRLCALSCCSRPKLGSISLASVLSRSRPYDSSSSYRFGHCPEVHAVPKRGLLNTKHRHAEWTSLLDEGTHICQHVKSRPSKKQAQNFLTDRLPWIVCFSLTISIYLLGVALPVLAEDLNSGKYTPSPYSPGWEVYVGFAAGVIPFIIGGYEFTKRIVIQQRCERCKGSGLVPKRNYRTERDLRKCPDCGGFFPWQGWGRFFTSTALPGNGGPLMAPKGQNSVFYKVPTNERPPERPKSNSKIQDSPIDKEP